jgi:feruloyl-CoA synthase
MKKAPLREIALWSPKLAMEERPDGSILVWREDKLGDYPHRATDPLIRWAEETPGRTWMAQRGEGGGWRRVSYAEALAQVRSLGQALLDRGVSIERPVVMLSENAIDHALIALGAQHVGAASASISVAYSLLSADHGKLKDVVRQLTPGLVYVSDGDKYRAAIEAAFPSETQVIAARNPFDERCTLFADLVKTEATNDVDRAHAAVGRDTVAKFLFTSGTTGAPKAVVQTHGGIASNQAMAADCYRFIKETPPVVVDWAPWSHTASGTKVFYLILFNGGSYYIDEGKPAPGLIDETVRNLREISPTWYFNVPTGYDLLVREMEKDDQLRESFFQRLQYLMYAGAAMAQHTWEKIEELSVRTTGMRILRSSSLGATETGPFALCGTNDEERPDNVGVPAQGVVLKLTPNGDKLEARLKSPSITPGYWRNPEMTKAAFDEEGFYRLGDALRFAVPGDPTKGFFFDGRIAENFKLRSGTFVGVGPLRSKLVNELGGLARDAVIAGEGRSEIGALLLPAIPTLRALVPGEAALSDAEILRRPEVLRRLETALNAHAKAATGCAMRVMRAMFLVEPPSLDKGEVTDKGSINQRATLRNRTDLVEALYSDDDPRVVRVARKTED